MMARQRESSPLRTLEEVEREHIERVLEKTRGNKTKAAEILGVSRRTLFRYGFRRARKEQT